MTEQELREHLAIKASQEGFPEYCVLIDDQYSLQWFHEQIALKLEAAIKRVENGEGVRLMIFMPPRHGKSDQATQKFPSWVLGKHPEWRFIVASYSQELATDFGQGTRDLMESDNYKSTFDTRLRADTQAKAKWMTDEGGGYTAVGVGGAITGRGFNIGIVDDPFKNREEADSPVTRESVHKWWRSTFYTRQEGKTAIILILTRWHDDDLAGRLLKEEEEARKEGIPEDEFDHWEVIKFPAIAEEDSKYRKKGEPLWADKFDLKELNRKKRALGSYEWSALYQQNPIDEENQEFKRSWIKYRTMDDVLLMRTRKFATIDSALSKNAKSDFTGVTRNWVNDANDWYIKSERYRISSKQLIDLVFTLHHEGFEIIGIEEGAYLSAVEPFLKEEMDRRGIYPNIVVLKHGGTMKETRIRGLIPRYENGKIFHIKEADINTCLDLEEEYLRFPKAIHDDCIDSLAYQNQIASPPSAGVGDRVLMMEIEQNLSRSVNDQSGTIIIGVSSQTPVHYVIGNSKGMFYNRVVPDGVDPWKEIDTLINKWKDVYIITDQVGDVIGLKELQAKYIGNVVVAFLKNDPKSLNMTKWGEGDTLGQVDVAKSAVIQQVVDEMRDTRFVINGTKEEWEQFTEEWANLYRVWDVDAIGEKVARWESNSPQHFIKAGIFYRTGLDRYSSTEATVVGSDMFEGMETGRFFSNGIEY